MASRRRVWIVLILLSVMTCDMCGVSGRAVDTRGLLSQWRETAAESSGSDALRRWRRGVAEAHRERCAELAAPWQENTKQAPEDKATLLQLRVRPFSPRASLGLLFPGKSLFSFVRRVYHCCQEGLDCRSVRGIQGRLRGGTEAEFLLTREILSLRVTRAELHLQLSNPHHLDIHPVLSAMAKRGLPTRYSLWSRGNTVELRVDLLFLLQSLQEAAGGAGASAPGLLNIRQVVFSSRRHPPGEETTSRALQDAGGDVWGELGLVLGCSQTGSDMSCGAGGVGLSHPPFMAVYYS
uniref:uncharacterized protein si:ch211-170d8.2 n=1 Tax=Scatophagus argus TaxID=75038 RepID=UPI001ED7E6E0|nr:uncharacterized protein si:ch211-170d8.2 [Scatophagus argus]